MVDSELALPAFRGYIGDTLDALLIFEGELAFWQLLPLQASLIQLESCLNLRLGCRRGVLYRVQGRLSDAQRKDIKSGDVYVFSEEESKIRRCIRVCLDSKSDQGLTLRFRVSDGQMAVGGHQAVSWPTFSSIGASYAYRTNHT